MIPNLPRHGPRAGGGMNRVAMSQGMGHLLQRINLPTIAVQAPEGNTQAVAERWGVPWANSIEELDKAAALAELAQLARTDRHFPDSAGERLWEYDDVIRQDIPPVTVERALLNETTITLEIGRAPVREYGMGVLERIATYVRYQALNRGGNPVGDPVELGDFVTFGPDAVTFGSPFPFPVVHPTDDERTFSVSYVLVFQNTPMTYGDTPPILPPTVGIGAIARGNQWRTWDDQRYAWGSRYTDRHQLLFGGHGILRLYAVISQTGDPDGVTFELAVAGRLGGYTQNSGVRRAAIYNATIRS